MIVYVLLHEATAYWDVRYATSTRKVAPAEQHVHSFLEILPVTGLLMVIALHWEQFISLFGFAPARFELVPKSDPLPWGYILTMMGLTLLFEVLPYLEERLRGLRHRSRPEPLP